MSRFDNTVNSFLNRLIFEQTANEPTDDEIKEAQAAIDEVRKEVEEEFKTNRDELISLAEQRVNSDEEIADRFLNFFKEGYEKFKNLPEQTNVTEQAEAPTTWADSIMNKLVKAGSYAGSYINGTFEAGLDYITDKAVENMPWLMSHLIGKDAYDQIRSEVENMEDKTFYKIFAFIDPTGVLSWPYLENAKKLYEENLGTENEDIYTLNLLGAALAVIPGLRYLGFLTLPFRLISRLSPFMNSRRAGLIGQAIAKELKGGLGLSDKISKTQNILSKSGRVGQMTGKVLSSLGKISRPIATISKALTVGATGDIPAMVKGWMEKGKEMVNKVPQQKTLMRIPSFQRISTQEP
jgi:hypothetical protein